MATQDPNTWEKLYSGIANQKTTSNEALEKLDQLHHIAQAGTLEDFQTHVSDLLHTYGEQLGLSADVNGQDILREANEWRDRNFPINDKLSSDTNQTSPQHTPDIFDALAAQLKKKGPEPARGSVGDSASAPLRSLQEQQLMDEFNHALKNNDEEAIEKLLSTRLEAPELLAEQWKIANQHIDILAEGKVIGTERKVGKDGKPLESEEEILRRHLTEQQTKQSERLKEWYETDEGKKHQGKASELKTALQEARKSGDTKKTQEAFQQLLRHQQSTTAQFTIFEELTDIDQPLLLNFSRAFAATMQQRALERQQQLEEENAFHADKGLYVNGQNVTQQKQKANNATNAFNTLKAVAHEAKNPKAALRGAIGNLAKKALAATPEGKAALLVIENRKKILIAILIIGFLLVALITAFIIVLIAIIQAVTGQHGSSSQNTIPIPGLTLTLDTNPPGQTTYPNGKNISFVIDATYTGTSSLIVTDNPNNAATIVPKSVSGNNTITNNQVSWGLENNTPLPNSTSSQKHWQFKVTFSNVGADTIFHNTVIAQYAPNSGPSVGTKTTTTQQVTIANGYCSPSNLAQPQYFGSAQAGTVASCICRYESGGNPGALNKNCLSGRSADWSVGLFQFNLDTSPQRCSNAFSQVGLVCRVANYSQLNSCSANLQNPDTNIKGAVALYHAAGNSFDGPWHAEKGECF